MYPPKARGILELLDRLNPSIAELSQAIEQEAEKHPEAKRLMTHPGDYTSLRRLFAFLGVNECNRELRQ